MIFTAADLSETVKRKKSRKIERQCHVCCMIIGNTDTLVVPHPSKVERTVPENCRRLVPVRGKIKREPSRNMERQCFIKQTTTV